MDINKELEIRLNRYFSPVIDSRFASPKNISDSIRYSLLASGKRIRPRFAIESSHLFDLSQKTALAIGLSIEMIHCFSLIHDDLPCMDNDDFRRGIPSNHKIHGEALALLAGDALLPIAIEVFSEASEDIDSKFFILALNRLMEAIGPRGVMGGQAEEMLLNKNSDLLALKQMHLKKTGALFEAAILIPAEASGWNSKSKKGLAIQEFAKCVGMGFQVTDDLEDQEQDETYEEPRSVLNFMSKNEAIQSTKLKLQTANHELINAFGDSAKPLICICEEVIKRLA